MRQPKLVKVHEDTWCTAEYNKIDKDNNILSRCCEALIYKAKHSKQSCNICYYCGDEVCSKCGKHIHCGGCI